VETSIRDALTDAIHYWERRRILYNLVLALIVVAVFVANWPASQARLGFDLAQRLFILAVLANIAYCAAYPVDLFAQLSAVRATWLRFRWLLFVIGMLFAAIIARIFTQSMFSHAA
jgi:hypothetical protein